MREIKFKQAITDNQTGEIRWHHWGYLHIDTAGCPVFINPLAAVEWDDRPSFQSTGLKDKNGVEIYEGDKWRSLGGKTYFVKYGESRPYESGEVVGNIHNDPK